VDRREQTGKSTPHWFLPLLVGIITFAFVWVGREPPDLRPSAFDVDYFWVAGHAVARGENPYTATRELIGKGRFDFPFYYPGTAAVVLAPFGALPHRLGVALFTALGLGLLTWSLPGWRKWILLSAPVFESILIGQWSPWTTAAVGLPWLGFIWAVKPSIGLALFAGWPSRKALYGGVATLLLSLLVLPGWPQDWLATLRDTPHYRAPILRPGGFLLLLAFLRWRYPEARMLGALALIPHTTGVYEQIPLLLIPQSRRTLGLFIGLTWLASYLVYTRGTFGATIADGLERQWPYFLVLVWLPALGMVLMRRDRLTAPPARPGADRRLDEGDS
jgi:hypothetical protein